MVVKGFRGQRQHLELNLETKGQPVRLLSAVLMADPQGGGSAASSWCWLGLLCVFKGHLLGGALPLFSLEGTEAWIHVAQAGDKHFTGLPGINPL